MKFYVLKLFGPRPTFVQDMTAEERTLMGAHSAYWRQQMALGKVVVFGPVMDPTGPYGLGVIRLEENEDPQAFWSDDPAMKANVGFRVEAAPMATAVLPVPG